MHGFICPECSADLKSAEALQAHYLKAHAQIIHEDDVCRMSSIAITLTEQATSSEDEDAHRKPPVAPAKVHIFRFSRRSSSSVTIAGTRNAAARKSINTDNTYNCTQ